MCDIREQTWDDHLDRLRGKKYAPAVEYASRLELCAASRILEGCIKLYSPALNAPVEKLQDERAGEDVKMTITWVHINDKGRLNHFELWLTADQVNDREFFSQVESAQPPAAIEGA